MAPSWMIYNWNISAFCIILIGNLADQKNPINFENSCFRKLENEVFLTPGRFLRRLRSTDVPSKQFLPTHGLIPRVIDFRVFATREIDRIFRVAECCQNGLYCSNSKNQSADAPPVCRAVVAQGDARLGSRGIGEFPIFRKLIGFF